MLPRRFADLRPALHGGLLSTTFQHPHSKHDTDQPLGSLKPPMELPRLPARAWDG